MQNQLITESIKEVDVTITSTHLNCKWKSGAKEAASSELVRLGLSLKDKKDFLV